MILNPEKYFFISHPIDGSYNIQVIGYASDLYTVQINATDIEGVSLNDIRFGNATVGSIDEYIIDFDAGYSEIYLPFIYND